MEASALLPGVRRVHFIGIGGSGMCSLAEILHAMGYEVSGSDDLESDNVARLRSLGISVSLPLAARNIRDPEAVVYTVAVSDTHPEMQAAKALGVPVIERAALLGMLTRHYPRSLAVAGTHGKTTTTSMVSQILLEAALDPTLVIGGRLPLIEANGRAGRSDILVCEACEFKDHFLQMAPAVSVILNIDADHLEYFGSLENIIRSFRRFSEQTGSILLVNGDDANTLRAVDGLEGKTIVRFGLAPENEWAALNITEGGPYGRYDLYHSGTFVAHIALSVPGRHNIANSVAAAAAASLLGASPAQIAAGLLHFGGAGRRFETVGTVRGVTIIDDYAHHPTEIAATIEAASHLGFAHVHVLFQPHRYSRAPLFTEVLKDDFGRAFDAADAVTFMDVYPAGEAPVPGVSGKTFLNVVLDHAGHPEAAYVPRRIEVVPYLAGKLGEGDLLITMGAGDVTAIGPQLVDALSQADGVAARRQA